MLQRLLCNTPHKWAKGTPTTGISGGSKGGREGRVPPPTSGPKFLHFHAVFGKDWPNNRLAPPPLGLAPPPLGNPGSATGYPKQSHHSLKLINITDLRIVLTFFLRTCKINLSISLTPSSVNHNVIIGGMCR